MVEYTDKEPLKVGEGKKKKSGSQCEHGEKGASVYEKQIPKEKTKHQVVAKSIAGYLFAFEATNEVLWSMRRS